MLGSGKVHRWCMLIVMNIISEIELAMYVRKESIPLSELGSYPKHDL